MAELLLRGRRPKGELRGRAARMEPIPDVAALRPVLASLQSKGLVISLTPEGRGHMVTHALYEPRELEKVRAPRPARSHRRQDVPEEEASSTPPRPVSARSAPGHAPATPHGYASQESVDALRRELSEAPRAALRASPKSEKKVSGTFSGRSRVKASTSKMPAVASIRAGKRF